MIKRLQDYITQQAEKRSSSTAIVMRDERITYGELREL